MTIQAQEIETFKMRLQEAVDKDYGYFQKEGSPLRVKIDFEEGSKYIRIVSTSPYGSRSAFGFIEKETGNILKSASWKAPAKNFSRGNIKDEYSGVRRVRWTGIY